MIRVLGSDALYQFYMYLSIKRYAHVIYLASKRELKYRFDLTNFFCVFRVENENLLSWNHPRRSLQSRQLWRKKRSINSSALSVWIPWRKKHPPCVVIFFVEFVYKVRSSHRRNVLRVGRDWRWKTYIGYIFRLHVVQYSPHFTRTNSYCHGYRCTFFQARYD